MASIGKVHMIRRRLKIKSMGRKRKSQQEKKGTTPTRAVLFGDVEPTK
ncbi:MAG: hypothetical protein AAB426_03690 [Myxococcota bacterium]